MSRSSFPSRLRRRRLVVALVAWTFLVWTTRIGTVWGDDELSDSDKVLRTGVALSFTALAVAVAATLVRRSDRGRVLAVDALAAWTTGVWVVRAPAIVLADHDAGFTVVHVALAVVSILLSLLAAREARRPLAVPVAEAGRAIPSPGATAGRPTA